MCDSIDYGDFAPAFFQSDYGTRLCDLLETGFDIGLRDYPIYDEADRDRLNQAIIDHFYTREIAQETPAHFRLVLNRTMRERMPQINRVHDAIERYNPFSTQETETESASMNESTSSDSGTSDSTARARALNTTAPQVSMVGKDDMAYYDSGTGTENASTANTRSDSTGTATSKSTGRSSSRSGYLSDQIAAWIDGYNNTDLMVFDALEVCFSQVLSIPDPLW